MYDVEKNLGLQRAERANTEISYEALTGRFDGLPPTQTTLNLVVYYYEELAAQIRARPLDESGRLKLLPEETLKLAFLRRISFGLGRVKLRSAKLAKLEAMKWLDNEL